MTISTINAFKKVKVNNEEATIMSIGEEKYYRLFNKTVRKQVGYRFGFLNPLTNEVNTSQIFKKLEDCEKEAKSILKLIDLGKRVNAFEEA